MRTYWRQRNGLVQAARHIQRMQKVLTQMNVQLANVLSDISGVTGQAIIKAILAGERDPHKLAAFRDVRVKASEEQIAQYLEGRWQEDLLFVLQQKKEGFDFARSKMAACDEQLKQYLEQQETAAKVLPCRKRSGSRGSKEVREHAAVRTASGVVSHERYESDPD